MCASFSAFCFCAATYVDEPQDDKDPAPRRSLRRRKSKVARGTMDALKKSLIEAGGIPMIAGNAKDVGAAAKAKMAENREDGDLMNSAYSHLSTLFYKLW